MTRYFLFEYSEKYPCGGFDDLIGVFESVSDALAKVRIEKDNIDIYSLGDDSNKPELLYYKFSVLDESNGIWPIIGNSKKKTIKLVGAAIGIARWPGQYKDAKMSDFKMEAE